MICGVKRLKSQPFVIVVLESWQERNTSKNTGLVIFRINFKNNTSKKKKKKKNILNFNTGLLDFHN